MHPDRADRGLVIFSLFEENMFVDFLNKIVYSRFKLYDGHVALDLVKLKP